MIQRQYRQVTALQKKVVLDLVRPLEYGRKIARDNSAKAAVEKEVQELEQLNLLNPILPYFKPAVDPSLNGTWRLVYSTSKDILGVRRPRPFRPSQILQRIDLPSKSLQNKETVTIGPFNINTIIEAQITDSTATRLTVQFVRFIFLGFFPIYVRADSSFIGWQDITYLDDDFRISRGNEGNLFLLEKVM